VVFLALRFAFLQSPDVDIPLSIEFFPLEKLSTRISLKTSRFLKEGCCQGTPEAVFFNIKMAAINIPV
jgi:hypothetical protein